MAASRAVVGTSAPPSGCDLRAATPQAGFGVPARKLGLERAASRADDADVADARRAAWSSTDLQEGLAAFRERRRPRFEGR